MLRQPVRLAHLMRCGRMSRSLTYGTTSFLPGRQPANTSTARSLPTYRVVRHMGTSPPLVPGDLLQKKKKKEVRENIYTIPNMLTMSRILATPGIGYLIITHQHVAAVSLLFVAGLTDVVDGYIARKYDMGSVVGTILDPFADKFLMTTLVVTLSVAGQLPTWLAVVILGRDAGLLMSALYWRWISLPPPRTFTRYWDMTLPSAEVHPTQLSKINTGLQLALVGLYTVDPILPGLMGLDIHGFLGLEGFSYLTAGTTIWSGLSYIWNKDAVKIIKQDEGESKSGGDREP